MFYLRRAIKLRPSPNPHTTPQCVSNKTNKTQTCAEFKWVLLQFSCMLAFVTLLSHYSTKKHFLFLFSRELQDWPTHPVIKEMLLLLVCSAELAGATDESGLEGWPAGQKSKRPPVRFIFCAPKHAGNGRQACERNLYGCIRDSP